MSGDAKQGGAILASLVAIPAAMAVGQFLFKKASAAIAPGTGGLSAFPWRDPNFVLGSLLFAGATVWWTYVLRFVPLSRAYPFMALAFLFVPALSWFALREPIGARQLIGIGFIVAGIAISSSDFGGARP